MVTALPVPAMGEDSDRGQELRAGPLVLNLDLYTVAMRGERVAVTPLEFDILLYLIKNSHRVVPQQELVRSVSRGVHRPDSSQVRVHIFHLRTKLGPASPALQTVRGRGLWFDAERLSNAELTQ